MSTAAAIATAASNIVDTNQLIASVYHRPALWDQSQKLYHNRDITRTLWDEVADECDLTSSSAKLKWRGLRDTFRRELLKLAKAHENGDTQLSTRWPFFEDMVFLKNNITRKASYNRRGRKKTGVATDDNADTKSLAGQSSMAIFNDASTTTMTMQDFEPPSSVYTEQELFEAACDVRIDEGSDMPPTEFMSSSEVAAPSAETDDGCDFQSQTDDMESILLNMKNNVICQLDDTPPPPPAADLLHENSSSFAAALNNGDNKTNGMSPNRLDSCPSIPHHFNNHSAIFSHSSAFIQKPTKSVSSTHPMSELEHMDSTARSLPHSADAGRNNNNNKNNNINNDNINDNNNNYNNNNNNYNNNMNNNNNNVKELESGGDPSLLARMLKMEDDDFHFVVSLLPSIRRIPLYRKNLLRLKILQLIVLEENALAIQGYSSFARIRDELHPPQSSQRTTTRQQQSQTSRQQPYHQPQHHHQQQQPSQQQHTFQAGRHQSQQQQQSQHHQQHQQLPLQNQQAQQQPIHQVQHHFQLQNNQFQQTQHQCHSSSQTT